MRAKDEQKATRRDSRRVIARRPPVAVPLELLGGSTAGNGDHGGLRRRRRVVRALVVIEMPVHRHVGSAAGAGRRASTSELPRAHAHACRGSGTRGRAHTHPARLHRSNDMKFPVAGQRCHMCLRFLLFSLAGARVAAHGGAIARLCSVGLVRPRCGQIRSTLGLFRRHLGRARSTLESFRPILG